jgi:DNA-binding NarL/FixJ family response regulator
MGQQLSDISESTVKVRVTHILEKLNVTGRTEAINVALKRGLVQRAGSRGSICCPVS